MSASELLIGLLVLAYLGSILVGGRTIRGFGLPSGAEYLLLGFAIGPHALGVVPSGLIDSFTPILIVGSSWLALVAGIGYLQVGERRVHLGRAFAGVLMAALVGAGVTAAVYFGLGLFFPSLAELDRLLLAGSAGSVSCATTRHAVRWVVERHGAKGATADALADYARASVLVPALGLTVLFALAPDEGSSSLTLPSRIAATLIVGVVLGLVATLLLGREFRRDESWGILLGTSLLGMGIAARLGLSALSTTFFLGLTVALVSPHRSDVKTMVAPTEKPVMLPVALLAGASVNPQAPYLMALVTTGLLARLLLELVRGTLHGWFVARTRPAGALLGLGMVSTGAFSLASAVALELRLPPELGNSVLGYTVTSLLTGELLGPLLLRHTLLRVGDIIPGMQQTPPPPSVDPSRTSREAP
ncbi:MAG: potassium transporter Kef [Polyangiaceae bacterium]